MSDSSAKRAIRWFLRTRPVNAALAVGLKPFARRLPDALLARLPYRGVLRLEYPGAPPVRLEADGRDWYLSMLFWKGREWYEPESTRAFLKLLPGTKTVLDVGANVGLYALLAAAGDPARRVYAFEPVPRVCERLKRNAALNGLANVEALACAVSDVDGDVTLHVPRFPVPVSASMVAGYRADCEEVRVPSVTLDAFARARALPRVDLLKMDTETTEPRVWAGARELLRRDRPPVFCECLGEEEVQRLRPLAEELEYARFGLAPGGVVNEEDRPAARGPWEFNDIFLPRERVKELLERLR